MDKLRRIAVMAGANTVRTFRSPMNVIWMMVVPVVFSLVIGMFFSSQTGGVTQLYVVNEDNSPAAEALVAGMQGRGYDTHVVSRDRAAASIRSGEHSFALVIPDGFALSVATGRPQLEMMHGPDYTVGVAETTAKAVARGLVTGEESPRPYIIQRSPRGHAADIGFPKAKSVFGVYLVFACAALFTRGGGLHTERDHGTLQRMVASGISYGEVVAAHVASVFVVGAVQSVAFLTITGALGTNWTMGGSLEMVLAVAGTLFVGAGMAVGLSGLTRSATVMQGVGGGLPALLAMTGGAFFPLDTAPAMLQQWARINPVYWMIQLLEGGLVYEGVRAQMVPLAVLLLIGVLCMTVGVQGLRRMEL